ncbi:MAG: hybrid sensor histidine kinase/response regulator, partial [Marinobacter sp.]|nr:hybrid sensor histidine kinase/response regulator [Marinobacter sp.]
MPSNRFLKRWGVRPLAARLLVYVLLFSLVLSLAATGVQMIGEFDRRKNDLMNTQTKAAELVSGGMSNNLWLMNFSEVANSLDDMKAVPAIQYAQVATTTGEEFSTGTYPSGRVISQTFPLIFDRSSFQEPQRVGTLTLVSSVEQIHKDLRGTALLTLLFVSLVVMLGTLGLLLIVRFTLSRHLEAMADYAAKLNLDALVEPLRLRRKAPRTPDELSELEQALNKMRLQILED